MMRKREDEKDKEWRKREGPKVRQTLGDFGMWLFLLLLFGQNWLCVTAAAEGRHRRKEVMVRMQQEVEVQEGRWAEENPQR